MSHDKRVDMSGLDKSRDSASSQHLNLCLIATSFAHVMPLLVFRRATCLSEKGSDVGYMYRTVDRTVARMYSHAIYR